MFKIYARSLGCVFAFLALSSPAFAHVTLEADEAIANAGYRAILRIPHGCEGEATKTLRVQIPEGVIDVKPMPKPGWTVNLSRGAYAQSYTLYGKPVAEGVREIVWSGGDLPDDY